MSLTSIASAAILIIKVKKYKPNKISVNHELVQVFKICKNFALEEKSEMVNKQLL